MESAGEVVLSPTFLDKLAAEQYPIPQNYVWNEQEPGPEGPIKLSMPASAPDSLLTLHDIPIKLTEDPGWFVTHYGEYIFVDNNVNFSTANADCIANDAHLPTFRNEEAFQALVADTHTTSTKEYWFGIQTDSDSRYRWVDDSPYNYTKFIDPPNREDTCGQFNKLNGSWIWATNPCHYTNYYVCQKVVPGKKWIRINTIYYLIQTAQKTVDEAQAVCMSNLGHLVSFDTEEQYTHLMNKFNTTLISTTEDYRIGLRRDQPAQGDLSSWYWIDQTVYNMNMWKETYIDGGEHCAGLRYISGKWEWRDMSCSDGYSYICKIDYSPKWTVIGMFEYLVWQETVNWFQARDKCVTYGGILVSFGSLEQYHTFLEYADLKNGFEYWIGLYQDDPKRNKFDGWRWIDESPYNYNLFYDKNDKTSISGEYSNTMENCIRMVYIARKWEWFDHSCTRQYSAICKKVLDFEWIVAGQKQYLVVEHQMDFNTASKACETNVADLVSFTNREQYDEFLAFGKIDTSRQYWLGLEQEQPEMGNVNNWHWVDGSAYQFHVWEARHISGNARCANMKHDNNMWQWWDIACWQKYSFICIKGDRSCIITMYGNSIGLTALNKKSGTTMTIYMDMTFSQDGLLIAYRYLAVVANITVYFAVWRPTQTFSLQLIGVNTVVNTRKGIYRYNVPSAEQILVQSGDVIGVHYPLAKQFNRYGLLWSEDSREDSWTIPITDLSRIVNLARYQDSLPVGTVIDWQPNDARQAPALEVDVRVTTYCDWFPIENYEYFVGRTLVAIEDAETLCQQEGGHHVSFTTLAQFEHLIELGALDRGAQYSIGLRTEQPGQGKRTDWYWMDGADLTFFTWGFISGEPTHKCARMIFSGKWEWLDTACDELYPFICCKNCNAGLTEEEEEGQEELSFCNEACGTLPVETTTEEITTEKITTGTTGTGTGTGTGTDTGTDTTGTTTTIATDIVTLVMKPRQNYVGCFGDSAIKRAMNLEPLEDDYMTNKMCLDHCQNHGYDFAGSQGKWCRCGKGNTFTVYGARLESECSTGCPGDATDKCGGNTINSVYSTSVVVAMDYAILFLSFLVICAVAVILLMVYNMYSRNQMDAAFV